MFTKDEFDSWNELFPDCIIRPADLSNPNETFLTKTLIAYLRMMGYKVEPPPFQLGTEDGSREKRQFLIKIVRHIDHVYKITDKSYSFTYCDLIHPTPKKTSHLLGILLNYLYYYNMYKTDVFNMANECIQEREDLLSAIKAAEQENKERKDRARKIKYEIEELQAEIPLAKNQLDQLDAAKQKQNEKLQKVQEVTQELAAKLDELKANKRHLKRQIVADGEAQELESQVSALKTNLAEQERLKSIFEDELKEKNDNMESLQQMIKSIEEALSTLPLSLLDKYKEIDKNVKDVKAQIVAAKSKREDLLQAIEKQKQMLASSGEKLELKQKQLEQYKLEKMKEISNTEQICNSYKAQLASVQLQDHSLECLLEEQEDIAAYLQESIAKLMADCLI